MDLLITVSNSRSVKILAPLLRACIRRQCLWQVFLTHDGVKVLQTSEVADILLAHKDNAIACHDSWQRYFPDDSCTVTVGSQTNHSDMAARAIRVVSL